MANAALSCAQCGGGLPTNFPRGLCPRCVARLALEYLNDDFPPGLTYGNLDPDNPRGRCFGDYELLEEVGRGGMGVVFKARQLSLNRVVAVKMLLHGSFSSPEYVKRFHAEAEAAAGLQHPNIVAIHEIGMVEGLHFFSMEYVEGPSLAQIACDSPLPAPRAARYVESLARAIHYAHERGILHRDLKPSNIILDASGQPRITDFGLAKRLSGDSDLTLSGQVLGAPAYMAPEQAAGKRANVGVPSDVYALGAILYFLLEGRPPFAAETLPEILVRVQTQPPAPLLNAAIPPDLKAICLKCLKKDPGSRYPSASALAEDLRRWLAGEPVFAARRDAPKPLLSSTMGIPRALWVMGAVASAVLLVLFGRTAFDGRDQGASVTGPSQGQTSDTPSPADASGVVQPPKIRAGVEVAWSRGPDLPKVHEESSVAILKGRLYVVGGRTGQGETHKCVSDVQVYDPETDLWSQAPSLPVGLAAVGLAGHNGYLYCLGGVREPYWWGYPVASAYRFDPDRREWTRLADMPIARSNFAVGVIGDRIYCAGGSVYWPDATSRIDAYEAGTDEWIHSGVMPQPRGSFTGGVYRGLLVLFQGLPSAKLSLDPNVYVFDPGTRQITTRFSLQSRPGSPAIVLFADNSGIYFLEQAIDTPSATRIRHLNVETGEVQVCEPPSSLARLVAAAAYDATHAVAYILSCTSAESNTRALEKARVLVKDEATP
ncbi:MAG TPA: protein kinase [Verrucomicrobiae bacterium]